MTLTNKQLLVINSCFQWTIDDSVLRDDGDKLLSPTRFELPSPDGTLNNDIPLY